ncbi:hypothetical protein BCR32DRAFT_245954 [Anaeromyces robustus]|uniref:Uncharacterized protein n=1 Tax=Anaeromyces robustus TaxID=1754192 RepID=A0A1Y1X2L3_9FUNG|nr:hypothetical protein BCR32DRAFT_245954 [Anaeromyces robustus]|eukprot:ORX80013.1 hypothetical protein BCR32DRAFT_245954 [Anaeromyces robustus]
MKKNIFSIILLINSMIVVIVKSNKIFYEKSVQRGYNPFEEFYSFVSTIRENVVECKNLNIKFYGEEVDYYYHCQNYEYTSCRKSLTRYMENKTHNLNYFKELDILCSRDYYGQPCPIADFLKKYNEIINAQALSDSDQEYAKYKSIISELTKQEEIYANLTCDTSRSCLDRAIYYLGKIYPYLSTEECSSRLNVTEPNIEPKYNSGSPKTITINNHLTIIISIALIILFI